MKLSERFKLNIYRPLENIIEVDVDMVIIQAQDGELGVLKGCENFITLLKEGDVVARLGTDIKKYNVKEAICMQKGNILHVIIF